MLHKNKLQETSYHICIYYVCIYNSTIQQTPPAQASLRLGRQAFNILQVAQQGLQYILYCLPYDADCMGLHAADKNRSKALKAISPPGATVAATGATPPPPSPLRRRSSTGPSSWTWWPAQPIGRQRPPGVPWRPTETWGLSTPAVCTTVRLSLRVQCTSLSSLSLSPSLSLSLCIYLYYLLIIHVPPPRTNHIADNLRDRQQGFDLPTLHSAYCIGKIYVQVYRNINGKRSSDSKIYLPAMQYKCKQCAGNRHWSVMKPLFLPSLPISDPSPLIF